VKVGAYNKDVATHVHLSKKVKVELDFGIVYLIGVVFTRAEIPVREVVKPHLEAIYGHPTNANSVLWLSPYESV
jgi:hypothetical protein